MSLISARIGFPKSMETKWRNTNWSEMSGPKFSLFANISYNSAYPVARVYLGVHLTNAVA